MEKPNDFETWRDEALTVWERIAPSYVRHDVKPVTNNLRDLWAKGATIDQFEEALEVAFASAHVTKRGAIFYAYGVVNRLLREAQNGAR